MVRVFRVVFLEGSVAACAGSVFLAALAFLDAADFFVVAFEAVVFWAVVTFSTFSDPASSFNAVVFLALDEAVLFAAADFRGAVFFAALLQCLLFQLTLQSHQSGLL